MLPPLPEINPNQSIVLDLETCDPELKFTAPGYISNVGFVCGIAIDVAEGSWYIPVGHKNGENYPLQSVVTWLNDICSADTDKVFHNGQYDIGWLKYIGVELHGHIFDTMLAFPLLNENRHSYQLDSIGKDYFGQGKEEEALATSVIKALGDTKTRKVRIRLKESEDVMRICGKYKPFIEAKERVSQLYDLWPKEVQDKYMVLGYESDKRGHTEFKVPCTRQADIKGLLWYCDPNPDEMGTYPIQDVRLTRKAYEYAKDHLKKEDLERVMGLENELLPVLLEMRCSGVRIDMDKAMALDIHYTKEIDRLQNEIDELCGFPVDVNIDSDLIRICEKLGLEYKKTAKGNPCFSAEEIPKDKYGIFDRVLAIRKLFKARDTYIRGYIFGCTIDGWLHGQYNQLKSDDGGTVTGRLSSSNPNMQNMPNPKASQIGKDIRSLFLPDNADEKWLSMDYSGQEPKMLVNAVILRDNDLWKESTGIRKPGDELFAGANLARSPEFSGREADFHTAVATICVKEEMKIQRRELTDEELKKAAKEFRPKAKSIGLGVMYGSGNKKVAEEMTKKGFPMTADQAGDIRHNIYEGVPFLATLSAKIMAEAQTQGYIRTILGRKGRFDKWEIPNRNERQRERMGFLLFDSQEEARTWRKEHINEFNEMRMPVRAFTYKALNKYIQGSSADQTKTAMVHLYKRNNLALNTLDIFYRRIPDFEPPKFKTQVHDEVNISMVKGESATWYQDVMEHCLPMEVEVVAEPVVCANWAEAK